MDVTPRKIWEHPWRYSEGFIIAAGIATAGFLLQFLSGNIGAPLFRHPVNTILGVLFVVGLLLSHFSLGNRRVVRWLSGVYATIPALITLLVLCVIMGIIPQFSPQIGEKNLPPSVFSSLGWHQMTTSWAFVLLCFYILTILGLTVLRRTKQKQSWREIGFYLNHIGLFIALLGGILGSADLERLTMSVKEGNVEWRAQTRANVTKELPIAIQLDTFMIEEYEPKLVIIDNETGEILPRSRPESYMFEEVGKTTQLAGIRIEIIDYLPHAAIFRDSIFTHVTPMLMNGAATAIKVRVVKPESTQPIEGWITNGSYLFPYLVLNIDENTSLAMPAQEVKKYTSQVTVYTEKGHTKEAEIEVNKPLSIENWKIYQYSYDQAKGKYSDVSVFELVRDPWLPVVYTGIFMLLAGALYLFIAGPKKKTS